MRKTQEDKTQIIILLGPNGAGKTTIGRMLEECFHSRFVSLEEFFLERYQTLEAYRRQRPTAYGDFEAHLRALLRQPDLLIIFEEVGLSVEAQTLIKNLQADYQVALVKISASEATCLKRVAQRGTDHNFPKAPKFVSDVWARFLSHAAPNYQFALEIENEQLSKNEICASFARIF